jgi:ribosomal protein L29
MKRNAKKELMLKTQGELLKIEKDLRLEIEKLGMDQRTGKTKNTSIAGNKRQELAQVLTVLVMKEPKKS